MEIISIITLSALAIGIGLYYKSRWDKNKILKAKLVQEFPLAWRTILKQRVRFYAQLEEPHKSIFENRVQLFLATKNVEGVDTEIDDAIRLMVASSAIIPTFAFPNYNYPNVQTVLIYPNSFDEDFQTQRFQGHQEVITGMVGNRFQNGTVILSKPDLIMAYDGLPHKSNVGIHEFVHLLDKEDGAVDGIPELLIQHKYVGPWLHEIKKEISSIEHGKSDIDPYALKNNAEFLAVVSEYFFDNPEKFKTKHPELYGFLSLIFNREKGVPLNDSSLV
jgi:MtfA peptidase